MAEGHACLEGIGRNNSLDEIAFSLLLGLKPLPYQTDFLWDRSDRIVFVGGRQIGKTTMTAVKGLYNAVMNKDWLILILAPTWRQSKIVFDKMREMLLRTELLQPEIERITQSFIYFKNGSKIYTLPAGNTGETVRGYSANLVIVDEGAYVPEEVYVSIVPSLAATNGSLWLLGTPAGKRGYFWEAWNSPEYSKHHAPSSANPLIPPDFLEEQRMVMTETQYRQEFLGEFVEESDAMYPASLVKPQMTAEWEKEPVKDWEYYLGVDVARMGVDETALVIAKRRDKEWRMVWYQTVPRERLTQTAGRIFSLHSKWRFSQIIVDETGVGGGLVDTLKEKLGNKARGFVFTSKERTELYFNLRNMLEKGDLWLLDDKTLYTQLLSIGYEYTSAGNIKIVKPEAGRDDLVDALALAVWPAARKREGFYIPESGLE